MRPGRGVIPQLAVDSAQPANDGLERIRARLRQFPRLRWVKVEGHAGVPENERADALATGAIAGRRVPR